MRINKHDTNGTKPLLGKGELGYDDYVAGGDVGRVYVGTGSENIALAERLESNMMTKAQFNALADERKANRAGSGFENFGKGSSTTSVNVNDGIWTDSTQSNKFYLGKTTSNSGTSITPHSETMVNGILQKLKNLNNSSLALAEISLPTAPNIYPRDAVLTAEQIASGVIKHADASNSGLIVNGKFDADTSGWTALDSSLVVESNKLKITNTMISNGIARQTFPSTIGKEYIVEFEATSGSYTLGMQIKGDASGITGWSVAGATTGRYTFKYTATTTTTYLLFAVYNNSLGAYAYVDNIAVYPADAISRSDLVFLESWHEDISEKNFVYPLGNVQYLGSNADGLTGIVNGAFTGFEQYSLFGNWQTPSGLIGKGYIWSNLTEAQKRAFIANPENNCYLDGDKTIQVRYRVRVVQGWGDSWEVTSTYYNTALQYNSSLLVKPKGKNTSIVSDLATSTGGIYAGFLHVFTDGISFINWDYGVVQASSGPDVLFSGAYEGKCFALPIALVHRRNQGAYHPVYNSNGTSSRWYSDGSVLPWYNSLIPSITSISDCFNFASPSSVQIGKVPSGIYGAFISSVPNCVKRNDGLFYDQVHESDITDLRNSSKKVEDYNRLISREFNKLVGGSTRGKEGEWEILAKSNVTLTYGNYFSSNNINNYLLTPQNLFPNLPLNIDLDGIFILLVKSGTYAGKVIKAERIFVDSNYFQIRNSPYPVRFTDGSIVPILTGSTVDIVFARQTTRTKSNTLLHCDIIGNPNNYPTAWKQSGVSGTPLIVAEDGTSLLPDGVRDTFKLSRKANATPLLCLRSTDNGATWTSFTPTFSTTTNEITLTNEPANNLVMIYYQTKTIMAVPVVNGEVLSFINPTGLNYNDKTQGAYLVDTLIGKSPIGVSAPTLLTRNLLASSLNPSNKSFDSSYGFDAPTHSQMQFYNSYTPAVKILPYLTRTNGKAYLNLVFKEMKYNGTSWGDNDKFNIVGNVSTTTDNNAQTVLVGQKTVELPYFIAGDE